VVVPGLLPFRGMHLHLLSRKKFIHCERAHYLAVSIGVEELDHEKLTPQLKSKYYDFIADTVADLGRLEEI
jgi:type I restriction enzyme, R subunit